jgi:hypothetical protein
MPGLADLDGIRHGFFLRQGGVSGGIYASLNCGLGSADEGAAVIENRRRVAHYLTAGRDAEASRVVTVHQVHSAIALTLNAPLDETALPRADALVTRTPGLVIGALAADCAPILFADPESRTVAAAHAGWRGAKGGIIEQTVAAMVAAGAERRNIRAAVGPCISQASYEVGTEFEQEFLAADRDYARWFERRARDAKPRFDLPGFVAHRLRASGVSAVEVSSVCTYREAETCFSYRRATHLGEIDYGRQISAITVS